MRARSDESTMSRRRIPPPVPRCEFLALAPKPLPEISATLATEEYPCAMPPLASPAPSRYRCAGSPVVEEPLPHPPVVWNTATYGVSGSDNPTLTRPDPHLVGLSGR
jgi:hypothetical protein